MARKGPNSADPGTNRSLPASEGFSWPNLAFLAPLPIATAAIGWSLWASLRRGRDLAQFIAAMGLFAMYDGI